MKTSYSLPAEVAFAVLLSSCAPTIPQAPDLQPVLEAYEKPTAVVDGKIMGEVADEIEEAAKEIEDSEIFEEILNVIIEVQQELEASTAKTCSGGELDGQQCLADEDCPGGTCVPTDLVLDATCSGGTNDGGECADNADCPDGSCGGGVILPSPTGVIQVNYICPGWDERQFDEGDDAQPDSTNGSIDLFMTLDSGGIGRVVWGTVDKCLYLVPNEGDNCEATGCSEASYDGGVALDLGAPEPLGQDITQLLVTFVLDGEIRLDDIPFGIKQSFRVILADESGLEILVDLADPALSETFVYIFAGDTQAIRDATGEFGCSLEFRQCCEEPIPCEDPLFFW